MRPMVKSRFPALVAASVFLAACVTVEENPLPKIVMIPPGQKTLVAVYIAPGPWVTSGPDTNAESAAKYLPGLGAVVEGAQDDRNVKLSEPLGEYLASWRAGPIWTQTLMMALREREFPGAWVAPPATPGTNAAYDLDPETLLKFNQAKNILEWRRRYFVSEPSELRRHRDYSTLLSLSDALVLEVNLQHGLSGTSEGSYNPALSAKARLYRAGTMRLLWTSESIVEKPAAAGKEKNLWDYMNAPKELTKDYELMMPELAQKISAHFHDGMAAARNLNPPAPPAAPPTEPVAPPATTP